MHFVHFVSQNVIILLVVNDTFPPFKNEKLH